MAQPKQRNTWSYLDAVGLLNGLSIWDPQYKSLQYVRRPFDTNLDLRDRIYSSHDNPGGVDHQGLVNALSNEFSLVPYNVLSKTNFQLSYPPSPSGTSTVSDVSGYYNISGQWYPLRQYWGEDYTSCSLNSTGFIVWSLNKYSNLSGLKNFDYSTLVEVFQPLPDLTELKFEYWLSFIDDENDSQLIRYTDIDSSGIQDTRFLYRTPSSLDLSQDIVVYTLNEIPSVVSGYYYTQNFPTDYLYTLKTYVDQKFRHTWDKITDTSCIWDVHKNYGSGEISSFYDAIIPNVSDYSVPTFSGYEGGIEPLSVTWYPQQIDEVGDEDTWYLKVYPGKFYVGGYSYYLFENPSTARLSFATITSGQYSGLVRATLPSGYQRGSYCVLSKSGYYENFYDFDKDVYLTGVYEDYNYYSGPSGNLQWSDIYRHRPFLTADRGLTTLLNSGEYFIDYSGYIYASLPPSYSKAFFVYEQDLIPTGFYLPFDLNPLNTQNLFSDSFFLYLTLDR